MADFKTHITTSSMLGLAYGGVACTMYDVPLSTAVLAGGLCSVSGMLPDIDSNSSRPLRESLAFGAAVVPMMLIDRFEQLGFNPESMVLAGALIYLAIRFGLAKFLREYTVHRGMFHSLPAAVIFGEIAFLLTSGDHLGLRIYKAGGVTIGYVSHLVLDEMFSVGVRRGRVRLKRSFGTALKMYSDKIWPNISVYAKLALFTYIVLHEPGWMAEFRAYRDQAGAQAEKDLAPRMELRAEQPAGETAEGQSSASPEADAERTVFDEPFFARPAEPDSGEQTAPDYSSASQPPAQPAPPYDSPWQGQTTTPQTSGNPSRTALEPISPSQPRAY